MNNGKRGPQEYHERVAIDCEAVGINRAADLIREQKDEIERLETLLGDLVGRTKSR